MKMPIRDIRMRLQNLTGLEHSYEDAYTIYQDETSGCHGVGKVIRRCLYEISE